MQPTLDLPALPKRIAELAGLVGAPAPSSDAIARAARFAEQVAIWNAKMAVVGSKTDQAGLLEILFADALVLSAPELVRKEARVVDVGSGFGAPALPLAILREDLDLTLVEPMQRRTSFLRIMIGTFDLAARVRVVEKHLERAEDLEGSWDVAISRATFAPPVWIPMGLELAKECVALTADDPTELEGARVAHQHRYALPSTSAPRVATRYQAP